MDGIKTNRLIFRKLCLEDIQRWEPFFEKKEILHFLGLNPNKTNYEHAKRWIEKQLWRYSNNQYGHHALINQETNELIGQAGLLTQQINGREEIEVGYHILPKYWNQHFATEAAIKVRDFAFENNITSNLISTIHENNTKSQRVANRIGMNKKEIVIEYWMELEPYGTFYIYRINYEEWNKIKKGKIS